MSNRTTASTSSPYGFCSTEVQAAVNASVAEWESLTRRLTGFSLLASLAILLLLWRNFDYLPRFIANMIRKCLHSASRNDVHIQVPMSKALAYQVDRWFTSTRYSKPLTLLYLTVVLILVGWLSLYAAGGASSYDSFWSAVAGAGIDWSFLSEQPQEEDLMVRIVAALLSVGGMLVTALMLGIVSDAISRKVDELAKGRSAVLEVDHTLILGWSDKIFCLLDQLCNANKSLGGAAIVILATMEKEEMEAALSEHQINLRGSSIICRSGNPLRPTHLHQVSVETCRSIIVLADNTDPDQSDADALRVVLCLMAVDEQLVADGKQGLQTHVVVEICDKDNEALVQTVGEERVITVVSHDIIGRIMIQCARQPGLSNVLEDVIGFEGNEFYMKEWPQLVGRKFREVLLCFEHAVPLGVKQGEHGTVILNPLPEYEIEEGDQIIVLAEDDDTYYVGPVAIANPGVGPTMLEENPKPEKYLFCGWRRDMDDMIMVLDEFAEPGSELWLYSDTPLEERKGRLLQGGLDPDTSLRNLKLVYEDPCLFGSLVVRKKLEALDMLQFNAILILADENASGHVIADADTRNLATLLLVRHLQLDRMRSLQGLPQPSSTCRIAGPIKTPRPEAAIAETRRMIKQQFTDSLRAMRRGTSLPPPPGPGPLDLLTKAKGNASLPPSPMTPLRNAAGDDTAQHGKPRMNKFKQLPTPFKDNEGSADAGGVSRGKRDGEQLDGGQVDRGQPDGASNCSSRGSADVSSHSIISSCELGSREQSRDLSIASTKDDGGNNIALRGGLPSGVDDSAGLVENDNASVFACGEYHNGLPTISSEDSSSIEDMSCDEVVPLMDSTAADNSSKCPIQDDKLDLNSRNNNHNSNNPDKNLDSINRDTNRSRTRSPIPPLSSLISRGRADSRGADSARSLRNSESSRVLRHSESGRSLRSSGSAWYNHLQPEMRGTVVISEILDSKARQLIKRLKISEFVLSNELVSMVLAMVSENRAVNDILQELLRQEGNELYVQPPEHYFHPHETLSFNDLLARAYQRREIVIGYTLTGAERAVLNPPQKSVRHLRLCSVHNVIVLALYDHYANSSSLRSAASALRSMSFRNLRVRGVPE